jgi:hypothetical protein
MGVGEECIRGILTATRIALPQHPLDVGVRRFVGQCKQAAGRVNVGNGLDIEDDQRNNESIQL